MQKVATGVPVSGHLVRKMTSFRFPDKVVVVYFCALGLVLELRLEIGLRFRSNVHSGRCTRSQWSHGRQVVHNRA